MDTSKEPRSGLEIRTARKFCLNRPIQLLYPLEVQSEEPVSEEDHRSESGDKPVDVPGDVRTPTPADGEQTESEVPRHSRRAAAQRANANRIACMFELEDN